MLAKRKYFLIVTLIILAAIILVICVSIFANGPGSEYDGTLVRLPVQFTAGIKLEGGVL